MNALRLLSTHMFKAMDFDGKAYVAIPPAASLRPTSMITLEARFEGKAWEARNDVIGKGASWHLSVVDGTPRFWLCIDGAFSSIDSPESMPAGRIFYQACTYDGSKMRLYINAALKASLDRVGKITYDDANFPNVHISGYAPASALFNGRVFEAHIYERALSASEIKYNCEHFDNPVMEGLVLWLSPESIGDKWYDRSGHGNHGTIYGATPIDINRLAGRVLAA